MSKLDNILKRKIANLWLTTLGYERCMAEFLIEEAKLEGAREERKRISKEYGKFTGFYNLKVVSLKTILTPE